MNARIVLILGTSLALFSPAQAEVLSPLFGSESTDAFQIVIDEPPALLQAEASLVGVEMTCELQDCPVETKVAKGAADAEAP